MVEIFGDGCGRCRGKLCRCKGLPVYHPDKYTGKGQNSIIILNKSKNSFSTSLSRCTQLCPTEPKFSNYIVVILNEDQKLTFLNNILAIKQSFLLFFNRKIINKYQENNRLIFFFKQKCPKFTGVCSNDDYLLCLL